MTEGTDPSAWKDLLARWSKDLLADPSIAEDFPPDVVASGWLGYPPASEEQIRATEDRLGTTLPPSYRAFLKTSNGWRNTTSFIDKLWSTDEIDWFRVRNRDWIEAWTEGERLGAEQYGKVEISDEEYFVYGEGQDTVNLRTEYLETALEISDIGDACIYLLNPRVVTADGEWEAWFFASWLPGAVRYRSFWDMMQGEYRSYLDIRESERQRGETPKPRLKIPEDGPRIPAVPSVDSEEQREPPGATRWVAIRDLRAWTIRVLEQVGVPTSDAVVIAEALLDAELRGEAGHGLRAIGPLVDSFLQGKLNPTPHERSLIEDPVWSLVDGDRGSGLVVVDRVTSRGIERSRTARLSQVYTTNVGELVTPSSFALRIASAGKLGCVATNAPSVTASADTPLPVLQPRSFACTIPTEGDPILFDQESYLAFRDAAQALLTVGLPPVLPDLQARPFEASLAMLAGMLNLPGFPPFGGTDKLTHLVFIVNPAAFPSSDDFRARMVEQVERAKAALGTRASDLDRLLEAGARRQQRKRQLLAEGKLPLTDHTLNILAVLGDRVGVRLPAQRP